MLDMIEAVPSRALSPAESATAARNREYLAFRLGHEEYGIDILKVQEIRSCDAITAIAGAPAHVKGVIDLRGIIVPIIDMRIRFNLEQASYDAFTVVIILNVGKRVVGIVVDAVSDVMSLTADQVRPPPEFGDRFDTEYVVGIGAVDDRMLILVDIEKLIGGADMPL